LALWLSGAALFLPGEAKSMDFGIKGGLNLAYQTDPKVIPAEYAMRGDFLVGAFASFRLSGRISLQPELYFSRKGVKTSDRYYSEEVRNRWESSYLELPILIKYRIGNGEKFRPFLLLGPYLSYRLSAKRTQTGFGTTEEKDITGEIWPGDYGLILAGLLEYKAGPGSIVVDLRLSWGLANVLFKGGYNSWVDPPPDPAASRNRVVSLMFGYGF
jgi:hypothetical protein